MPLEGAVALSLPPSLFILKESSFTVAIYFPVAVLVSLANLGQIRPHGNKPGLLAFRLLKI